MKHYINTLIVATIVSSHNVSSELHFSREVPVKPLKVLV